MQILSVENMPTFVLKSMLSKGEGLLELKKEEQENLQNNINAIKNELWKRELNKR